MIPRLSLIVLMALAACGVDGAPQRPVAEQQQPGVSISGHATVGVITDL